MWLHGIILEKYIPTKADLNFTAHIVNSLNVGGVYVAPRNGLCYVKMNENNEMKLCFVTPYSAQDTDEDIKKFMLLQASDHNAFKACAKQLGFNVNDDFIAEHAKENGYDPVQN